MPRKSQESWNPIRRTRLENHKTLEQFSHECKVHIQAVYLNEMGMYPTVLPAISRRLVEHYGRSPTEIEEEYQYYVVRKRLAFGVEHQPYDFGESDLSRNPVKSFRTTLGYNTAFGFATAIAVNPTLIRRVESCKVEDFPKHLIQALRDINLSARDVEELQLRHREYFYSGIGKVKSVRGSVS